MSGGSFNYLYSKDITEAASCSEIVRMAISLRRRGFVDAAARTAQIAAHIASAERGRQELEAVWRAVEWVESCDWGDETIAGAVNAWRAADVPKVAPDVVDILERLGAFADEQRTAIQVMGEKLDALLVRQ